MARRDQPGRWCWAGSCNGFTLPELAAAVAIISILLFVGIPEFQALLDRHRVWTSQHRLLTVIQLARQHAVTHGTEVLICGTRNAKACDVDAWTHGWIVFESPDSLQDCQLVGTSHCHHGGRVLTVERTRGRSAIIRGNTNIRKRIRFNELGASPLSNGTFRICSGNSAAHMVLSNAGRARTATVSNDSPCE